ncbi:hypothetical protein GCM10010421_25940 [Streptomyces glaucus]|uniref:Secreted protein n=1 Tax=Streptomyces glaucus TaxID=284029 RepID=A0ABN3JRG5_9ACTN
MCHKGGAHGVRARGMSVSQVIAAGQGSLNHISHVSGDTCHMMPGSPARSAGGGGPHRVGVGPVRPWNSPEGRRKGRDALLRPLSGPRAAGPHPIGDPPPPSAGLRPNRPTAFGRPGLGLRGVGSARGVAESSGVWELGGLGAGVGAWDWGIEAWGSQDLR